MAVRAHRKSKSQRILVPAALNPTYRDVLRAVAGNQNLAFELLPYDPAGGRTSAASLEKYRGEDLTALVIQQPNFFGMLEDVDALTDAAHAAGMLVIAVVNPVSLALLKPPGQWGARGVDIVCGEGQPLGVPLSSGGPYFGFMTTRMEFVRQMPGRIVGRTVDLDGKPGFTLTLQAREQHIRRSKATSNICTNQGLLVTAATIYMSLVGPHGLAQVAATSMERSAQLVAALTGLPGVRLAFDGPRFHEAVLLLDRPVRGVLEALAARGIVGGCDLSADYPSLGHPLLVCATETRTEQDIEAYARALSDVMQSAAAA
jgi:glycine dehydrogenase subunit 1